MKQPETVYRDLLTQYREQESVYRRRIRILAWSRLSAFSGIAVFFYLALTTALPAVWFTLSGISLLLLLFLIRLHLRVFRLRRYFECLVEINENELKALDFETLTFDPGSEFIQSSHAYASDLDLFGQGSFFQYLNRTVTRMGRQSLVKWLNSPGYEKEEILKRQEACREASAHTEWREHFMATGRVAEVDDSPELLFRWLDMPGIFTRHRLDLSAIRVIQALVFLLLILVLGGWASYRLLILFGLINLALVGYYLKRIGLVAGALGKTYAVLDNYSGLMKKAGESGFTSGWFAERMNILSHGQESAATEINALRKILQRFDSRNNLLIGFTRNALFLTDLELIIRMEAWKNRNAARIPQWLEILGEIDALNSLATFACNNPDYAYPVPEGENFHLEASQLGHPLIHSRERICNDIDLAGWQQLVILTGANMAGKSTFLRTLGLNHILAHTGAPVCAAEYRFYPVPLITSIRTDDSLIKHESYFYAELKKLKSIIDTLKEGQELFILLDEVLKGTNSNDKLNGSTILVKKLLGMNVSGVIATHDIALGELEKDYPGKVSNACFEAEIIDGELSFSYLLQQGTAKNMTALFLMKQMGIV